MSLNRIKSNLFRSERSDFKMCKNSCTFKTNNYHILKKVRRGWGGIIRSKRHLVVLAVEMLRYCCECSMIS